MPGLKGQKTFVDKSKPKDMRTSNILAGKCKYIVLIHFLPFFTATVLHFAGCSVRRVAVWLAQIAPSKHTEYSSWVSPVLAGQGKDKRMAKVLNVHILPSSLSSLGISAVAT